MSQEESARRREKTYVLQSLLCFNLHNCEEGIVGFMQILSRGLYTEFVHWKWGTEPSLALRWKFCRFQKLDNIIYSVYEWHNNAMRTRIQSSFNGRG